MQSIMIQLVRAFVSSKSKKSEMSQMIITVICVFVGFVFVLAAFLEYVISHPIESLNAYFSGDEIATIESFQIQQSSQQNSQDTFLVENIIGLEYLEKNGSEVKKLINEGFKHIGKPYVWAAYGPNTFDCSGYVAYCLRKSGVQNVPARPTCRTLWQNDVVKIHPEEKRPGDLIFFAGTQPIIGASHIGIYIGEDKYLEANSEKGVKVSSTLSNWAKKYFYGYGRPKALIGGWEKVKSY